MKLRAAGPAIAALLAAGALAVPVGATAASTRAEYIAQVDPLCRQNLGPWQQTLAAEAKAFKKWLRLTKKGTLKAWVRQTHKYARALKRHVEVHASLTAQIAAVAPPPEDAQLVATWLMYRSEYERLARASAEAFNAFKFKRSDKLFRRAMEAGGINKEWAVAASLGLLEACK